MDRFVVLTAIFAAAAVAGFAAYRALGTRPTPVADAARRVTAPAATSAPDDARLAARAAPSSVPILPPAARRPPAARETQAPDVAAAIRRETGPASERVSRKDVRAFVERTFKGKLPDRELTPSDYDRLTDVVMRLRSMVRAVRRDAGSAAGAGALDERSRVVAAALAEIQTITGVPPSDLGNLLAADEGSAEDAPEGPAPLASPR